MAFLTALVTTPVWVWLLLLAGVVLLCTAFRNVGASTETTDAEGETEKVAEPVEDEVIEAEVLS
jgi:hypothetical protein